MIVSWWLGRIDETSMRSFGVQRHARLLDSPFLMRLVTCTYITERENLIFSLESRVIVCAFYCCYEFSLTMSTISRFSSDSRGIFN